MRLYYLAERETGGLFVRTALGVDATRWNDFFRDVLEWRAALRARYGIPPVVALQPSDLLQSRPGNGPGAWPSPGEGAEVFMSGLRLIERASREGEGIEVISVCLPAMAQSRHGEVSLGRLLTRIDTSATVAGTHAFLILEDVPWKPVMRLYRRLCVRNPIPSRFRAWSDGAPTRNIPVTRIIGGPAFRSAGEDHLLQLASFVAHALLLQERGDRDSAEDLGLARAFSILDHALNREASQRDLQGIVRR